MVLIALFSCFLALAIGVLLVIFPESRIRLASSLGVALSNGRAPLSRLFQKSIGTFALAGGSLIGSGKGCIRFIRNHPGLCGLALLMIAAPSLVAMLVRGPTVFDFADNTYLADRQIATLLEGEQLVPPAPLPPEAFTTREVELVRPDAVFASRNWKLLDPEFTQRLLVVFKLMQERHGYQMALIEGYRSPERQTQLAAQGSHVTQAGAYMSYHQYGLAADCAFYRDGKIVISEQDPWAMRGYELFGEIAEQVGLTWGGRWKMRDLGHTELRRKGVLGRATP